MITLMWMPVMERSTIRHARERSEILQTASGDSVHSRFSDDQLAMLNPFLASSFVPDESQLESILAGHPMRACRPGLARYPVMLETLARFCHSKGKAWSLLEMEVCKLRADSSLQVSSTVSPRTH